MRCTKLRDDRRADLIARDNRKNLERGEMLKDCLPTEFLNVMASPFRVEILEKLSRSVRTVGSLAVEFDLPVDRVSYHLKHLLNARLVSYKKDGTSHPYQLSESVIISACDESVQVTVSVAPGCDLVIVLPRMDRTTHRLTRPGSPVDAAIACWATSAGHK